MAEFSTSGLRVLIAENYADNAETTAMFLRLFGQDVEIAPDGRTALELAESFKPDIVLIALELPKVNGFEVAKKLSKNRHSRTPLIVAISGYVPEVLIGKGDVTGIDMHLIKPYYPEHLKTILDEFKQSRDGNAA